jgi:hypothetical protein
VTQELLSTAFDDVMSVAADTPDDTALGGRNSHFECCVDEDTVVSVMVYDVEREGSAAQVEGYWLVATVVVRNARSRILALLLTAAAARLVDTCVEDEAMLIGSKHEWSPDEVVTYVRSLTATRSFSDAANMLAAKAGTRAR